jgi:hypothetical protein
LVNQEILANINISEIMFPPRLPVYKKWAMSKGVYLIDLYLEMHLPAGLAKFMTAALNNYCIDR